MNVWKTLLVVFLYLGKYNVNSIEGIVPFGQPLFASLGLPGLPENPNPTRDRTRYRHRYPINPIIRTAGNNNTFAPALWDLASNSYPVDFFCYTKDNPYLPETLTVNNASESKYFDKSKPTKFVIHDFMQSTENSLIHDIKDAYMNKKEDYNVIMVDWEPARTYTYTVAVTVSEYVGKMAARIVQAMKMDSSKIHVIGFGLGAHAAGVMGNDLKQQMNMTVARITDSEDAAFVDVIHTDSGDNLWNSNHLGMGKELGHVDIYPNRGIFQPGCRQNQAALPNYNSLQCSHQRALEIFKESIDDEMSFVACKCPTWTDFMESKCNCMMESNRIFVGEACPSAAHRGNYYLVTNESPPFGLGGKGTSPVLTRAADPGIVLQNLFSLNGSGSLIQGIGQLTSIFTSPFKPFLNTLVRGAQQFNENFQNNINNNNNNIINNNNQNDNFNNNNQNDNFNINQDIILNENETTIIPPMIPMPDDDFNENFNPLLDSQLHPPI